MLKTPWTKEQVEALNLFQKAGAMHPFTCGNNSSHADGHLIATPNGWICPVCDYTQDWAHEFMLSKEARTHWFELAQKEHEEEHYGSDNSMQEHDSIKQ